MILAPILRNVYFSQQEKPIGFLKAIVNRLATVFSQSLLLATAMGFEPTTT